MKSAAGSPPPISVAGHAVVSHEQAGGLLNLRISLRGAPLVDLARALAQEGGVRVTKGPERCFLVHCPGFKLVLSAPTPDAADHAVALVSRAPQAALALLSDLGALLERLMSEPPPAVATAPAARPSPLRRSTLQPGTPLARKTELKRRTPLARGRFNRG
jgi:hypothetical protein